MGEKKIRKLRDGTQVAVHENDGIRKLCGCPRPKWAKCPHAWHFSYSWRGTSYRFGLNKYLGKKRDELSKTAAENAAEVIRTEIRAGKFKSRARTQSATRGQADPELTVDPGVKTFEAFAKDWEKRRGYQLVGSRENAYRIGTICAFVLPQGTKFGDKPITTITPGDIEAFRHHRLSKGLSVITVNHDLKLLRKMFRWGIREGLLEGTPFRTAKGEATFALAKEPSRSKRLDGDDQMQRLLKAAINVDPHLASIIIAMLETCCRPGEVLSLQVRDVDMQRREVRIRAENAKDREPRMVPVTARLGAVLEMRLKDADGRRLPSEAFVFGDGLGNRRKAGSVRAAWDRACAAIGLRDFHLADLRHEAASQWEEAGVGTHVVSTMLGHSNLKTTTIYINAKARQLHNAAHKMDQVRAAVAKTLQNEEKSAPLQAQPTENDNPQKPLTA